MTVFKDICSGRRYTDREGQDKTAWTRVGVLIEKDGKQYVKLEAIPLPNEKGEVFLTVFEPRERGQGGQSQPRNDLDSDILF